MSEHSTDEMTASSKVADRGESWEPVGWIPLLSGLLGTAASVGVFATDVALIECLLLVAILVLVPLGLWLILQRRRDGGLPRTYLAAIVLQPFGAAGAVASAFMPSGTAAGVSAAVWLLVTLAMATHGLSRLLQRGPLPVEELAIDVGLMLSAVGGVWLVLSRLGWQVGGFAPTIVLLTAVHFHYTGFAAHLLAGMVGRLIEPHARVRRWVLRSVVVLLVTGTVLVAIGISASRPLELVGTVTLAVAMLALAGSIGAEVVAASRFNVFERLLSLASILSILFGMGAAVVYASGRATGQTWLTLDQMVHLHGVANSVGFAVCGLGAMTLIRPESRARRPHPPWSALTATGGTHPDYFDRLGAVPDDLERPPEGLIDDMSSYERTDFEPDALHPSVRAFYEETDSFRLVVKPDWKFGWRWAGRLWRSLGRRMGQMHFPTSDESLEDLIASQIIPVDDRVDGRAGVRAWIRTYAETGEAMYVAAYASHRHNGTTYMNIAFPWPAGNLTSILHLEHLDGDSLLLTTLPAARQGGDQGIYVVNPVVPVRIPMNETIRVWPSEDAPVDDLAPNAVAYARHDIWLFGVQFLELEYLIYPD